MISPAGSSSERPGNGSPRAHLHTCMIVHSFTEIKWCMGMYYQRAKHGIERLRNRNEILVNGGEGEDVYGWQARGNKPNISLGETSCGGSEPSCLPGGGCWFLEYIRWWSLRPPRASGNVTKVLIPEGPDYHHLHRATRVQEGTPRRFCMHTHV
jgi:hypothetical protein